MTANPRPYLGPCEQCGSQVQFIGNQTWTDANGGTRCPEGSLPYPRPSGRNLYHRPARPTP